MAKFAEIVKGELLRIPIPRTPVNKGAEKALYTQLLFPGSRHYDSHLKRQGTIFRELLPLCDDVALQGGASCIIHLCHRVRQWCAVHVLPEKLLRCRET